jgi:hypothetical protein
MGTISKLDQFIKRYNQSVEEEPSAHYDAELEYCEDTIADLCAEFLLEYRAAGNVPLPVQGKEERRHLYLWMRGEEEYVVGKFDIDHEVQRRQHDEHMRDHHVSHGGWWVRQIVQYYDRANMFFAEAASLRDQAKRFASITDEDTHKKRQKLERDATHLELRAKQAIVKAMMTAKGCAESAIRVYGNLPMPGVPSGEVQPWT